MRNTFLPVLLVFFCGCNHNPGGSGGGGGAGGSGGATGSGSVPELGSSPTLTVVGTTHDGLSVPRDLKFDPAHPEQLWVADEALNGIVLFTHPGEASQTAEVRVDFFARHFMIKVSSISFGAGNEFASCQESHDEWNDQPQQPDNYMGPTLWLADLDIFAMVNQAYPGNGKEGSHIDMLHESPLCMGIAWDHDNVYWAFDGENGHIVRYDFQMDHGPGGSDHSDGIVRRYLDATVVRVPEVASHMILDHATGMLYVADSGNSRVMRLDTTSGTNTGALPPPAELLVEYSKFEGAKWTQFAGGFGAPSGIALKDGRVFVSDYATGEVKAFSLAGDLLGTLATGHAGIMGITFGPDGKLWFADGKGQVVVRVDP
jgi:hypothetical protein